MQLNQVRPNRGATKKRKRVGRGPGSGHGGTATKGHKGEQARAGRAKGKGFEGGQMPLTRRIPKFGFKNPFRVEYQVVNVGLLEERFDAGSTVDVVALYARGVLHSKYAPVKLLGSGSLTKKLQIQVDAASDSARKKVEEAGGSLVLETAPESRKRARAATARRQQPAAGPTP
jgi:large subunit ribosomal protein L15